MSLIWIFGVSIAIEGNHFIVLPFIKYEPLDSSFQIVFKTYKSKSKELVPKGTTMHLTFCYNVWSKRDCLGEKLSGREIVPERYCPRERDWPRQRLAGREIGRERDCPRERLSKREIVQQRDFPRERLSKREIVQERECPREKFSKREIVQERDCPRERFSKREIVQERNSRHCSIQPP